MRNEVWFLVNGEKMHIGDRVSAIVSGQRRMGSCGADRHVLTDGRLVTISYRRLRRSDRCRMNVICQVRADVPVVLRNGVRSRLLRLITAGEGDISLDAAKLRQRLEQEGVLQRETGEPRPA